ncbi:MAG: hypothetical protein K1X68_10655 [Saprospiraceae bacterium]|nr:hypothetical protein [Saprospiraceae bacterium]HMW39329.1 hypothetical protein [Saprospiraceae bacterium]HMX88639.1 hypothetical protein [Saprospiraceae bacterium]HMZ40218.1 hypothetical protein [Saprospiraceae bacterium]HNA65518.1 hypothetical protein [Saprospiraceae bacterium]
MITAKFNCLKVLRAVKLYFSLAQTNAQTYVSDGVEIIDSFRIIEDSTTNQTGVCCPNRIAVNLGDTHSQTLSFIPFRGQQKEKLFWISVYDAEGNKISPLRYNLYNDSTTSISTIFIHPQIIEKEKILKIRINTGAMLNTEFRSELYATEEYWIGNFNPHGNKRIFNYIRIR